MLLELLWFVVVGISITAIVIAMKSNGWSDNTSVLLSLGCLLVLVAQKVFSDNP
jgi:hypothetical protein